ncbi:polysaccharide deacetylase family protein [Enterococcus faecium]|uniref:polysaccharide deacetylase family protein n=1 Tax=Enterococcus TaxID=1350 RepID=UPI000A349E45|nr:MULTISPECIES: polysaccharide deacetylase family protein [Enterococcus]EGP4759486.1 polysaccharide deacetylase family protein [Enterococcus faecium]EGP5414766.1 polysaccharide deacetylase family protein [Enterococcus faecium]EJB5627235.1 polysaccharide deacetylase family protein [Enterococcus faecium]EME8170359.1 polysaccharide deacetylase family protein [Enterococcus faecium]EME8186625.1 polysaccharide deacetylase family protein [Enterococcus faecium]
MKRNYLVISIIALSVLLFFEVTSVASLISEEKGQVTSSERSSQSFNQSEQSTNKNKSTETARVNASTQESVEPAQGQSTEPEPTQESTEAVQDPTVKSIAISFDDGPGATTTPQLLQILKEKNVHATFFVLGENTAQHPEIVKQTAEAGHEIGNHTYDHQDLATLSAQSITEEVTKTDTEIKKVTGKTPTFVRPPYGLITSVGASVIQRPIIEWSVDSEDWKTRNPDLILQKIQATVYDGAIILFHDIYPETIRAVPQVIDYLQEQGYRITTVGDLLGHPTTVENYYGRNDHRPVQ